MPFVEPTERLNVSMVKSQSRRLVFRHIFRHGPVTRPEIAQETGLSQGTVKTVVDEFMATGLLVERKDTTAQVGRKPLELTLNREARSFGVLSIQPDRAELQQLDLTLQPIGTKVQLDMRRGGGFQPHLERIARRFASFDRGAGSVSALGVVVPGPYDAETDRVRCRIMPELLETNLRATMSSVLDVPIAVGEDVQLAAIAEGSDPHRVEQPLFYFFAGTGVGGSYMTDGKVIPGATGMAGEIGQLFVSQAGMRLEEAITWPRFLKAVGVATDIEDEEATRMILRSLTAGEARAIRSLDRLTMTIAEALNAMVCLLNPRTIVIGGPYAALGERLIEPLRRRLDATLIPEHREQLQIIPSRAGAYGMIRGAAVAALELWLDTAFQSGEV